MKQSPRRYFSQSEMAEIWDRWARGETVNAIAWNSPTFIRTDSTRLQENLTNDLKRPYNSIHRQRNLPNVLRRSIESAADCRRSDFHVSRRSNGHNRCKQIVRLYNGMICSAFVR